MRHMRVKCGKYLPDMYFIIRYGFNENGEFEIRTYKRVENEEG